MKRALAIIGLGLFITISVSSCIKSRNCECTTVYTDGSFPSKSTYTFTGTKQSAQTLCDANNYTSSYSITTCTLK
jgi:hypothetical protein